MRRFLALEGGGRLRLQTRGRLLTQGAERGPDKVATGGWRPRTPARGSFAPSGPARGVWRP